MTTGQAWRQKTPAHLDAGAWRQIVSAVAVDMDTTPERLMIACGLSGATAAGIMSGRFRTLSRHTAERLRLLLILLPPEGGD